MVLRHWLAGGREQDAHSEWYWLGKWFVAPKQTFICRVPTAAKQEFFNHADVKNAEDKD